MTPAQVRFAKAMTEILVYIVVLNLFVEYVDTVVIESFTVSVVTAIVLWLILRVVVGLERSRGGLLQRASRGLLPGS